MDRFQKDFESLKGVLSARVLGMDELLEKLLLSALAGGHVLLEGNPGQGKTLLARTLAGALGLPWRRIQLTPDLLPSDLLGTEILRVDPQTGARELRFRPGPLHTHLVLADEINRATPRTQSALLEAMAEGQVTVGDRTHRLPRPFLLLATQNPVEMEGTFPLPEAQLDRFALRLRVPYPSDALLREVVRGGLKEDLGSGSTAPVLLSPGQGALFRAVEVAQAGDDPGALKEAEAKLAEASAPRLRQLGAVVRGAVETEGAVRLIAKTLLALQPGEGPGAARERHAIRLGPSPRAGQWWLRLAAARAARRGQAAVGSDDVEALAQEVLGHRLLLHPGEDPATVPRLIAAAVAGARLGA